MRWVLTGSPVQEDKGCLWVGAHRRSWPPGARLASRKASLWHAGREGYRNRCPAPALPPLTAADGRWVGHRRCPAEPTAAPAVAAKSGSQARPRCTRHRPRSVRRRADGGCRVGVARAEEGWARVLEARAPRRPTRRCVGVGGRARPARRPSWR